MCLTFTGVVSLYVRGGGGGFVGVFGSRRSGSGVGDRDVRCLYDSGVLDLDLVGSCSRKYCVWFVIWLLTLSFRIGVWGCDTSCCSSRVCCADCGCGRTSGGMIDCCVVGL